jgi:Mn-dependent DtxR family transcriptional regulator
LILTDRGRDVARRIKRRHETLARFFSLFGLNEETQRKDIEGIEHHLSPETLAMLSDLAAFFEGSPKTLEKFLNSRGPATK